jgi:predicted ribonuclease YlaK
MEPWLKPIYDIFADFYNQKELKKLIETGHIEICPLAYMRGRTFKDTWIIADEMQNATINQVKMLLTRIGQNSRMVLTGDLAQHDRNLHENGLFDFIRRLPPLNSTQQSTQQPTQHPTLLPTPQSTLQNSTENEIPTASPLLSSSWVGVQPTEINLNNINLQE